MNSALKLLSLQARKLSYSIFILLFFCGALQRSYAQDTLYRFEDTHTLEAGYQSSSGAIIIPLGKYAVCMTDTLIHYALVYDSQQPSWVAINKQGKILYNVLSMDNGPDYAELGLLRIEKGGKIGYADAITGEIAITPKYDGAYPFDAQTGLAKVCIGCTLRSENEVSWWTGGQWYTINSKGELQ